jgi:hypothetical protein
MNNALQQRIVSLALSALVVLGLIVSGFYVFLALVFLGNFDSSNAYHIFAFWFTFAAPLSSFSALVVYHFRPNRCTALASLLAATLPFGTVIVWSVEGSRGLMH